nr:MAG TPA: Portal protein [Caudoviricetes sp.]
MKQKKETVSLWQERLEKNLSAYAAEQEKMQRREAQYRGERKLTPLTENDRKYGYQKETSHVWNITAENIESEIDSSIPMPKVTPMRREDEHLARMIENMLRNELDRIPTEEINDESERITYKQGGCLYLPEWDTSKRTHTTVGENTLKCVHPMQFVPQNGVQEIDEMEYYFWLIPVTKGYVRRRYGVDVGDMQEEMPEVRSEEESTAEDVVTLKIAEYRNEDGGVGRFAWVGNLEVENLPDCQARILRRCKKCGQTEADSAYIDLSEPTQDGSYPEDAEKRKPRKGVCSFCGANSWEDVVETSRRVRLDELDELGVNPAITQRLRAEHGFGKIFYRPEEQITEPAAMDAMQATMGSLGAQEVPMQEIAPAEEAPAPEAESYEEEIEIPYYKPDIFMAVLRRNVTAHGKFLGESDCDKIADQQNTINRLEQKTIDRLMKAGSKITLPDSTHLRVDPQDNGIWYVGNAADASLIAVRDFQADITPNMAMLTQAYEESRRLIGMTDSYQGRTDPTAQSGKAKEFAAAQSAGRLESKRVLKKAAYARIFERMFKNQLAYCEEKRPLRFRDEKGNQEYEEWNSYAFLRMDDAGELYWNDQFLFSCDDASGLATNREAMWQETTAHLQSGAFGDPKSIDTLILYWTKMEEDHFPGAGKIKSLMEQRREEQLQQQMLMMQAQMAMQKPTEMGG